MKSTIISEQRVPFPRKNPNCESNPCVDMLPNKNPTIVRTPPEVRIETVTEEIVLITACFLLFVFRSSLYLSENNIA